MKTEPATNPALTKDQLLTILQDQIGELLIDGFEAGLLEHHKFYKSTLNSPALKTEITVFIAVEAK